MIINSCHFCGQTNLKVVFTEFLSEKPFTNCFCKDCNVYQTIGHIDEVSPDYISLEKEDITEEHRFLQMSHKLIAFNDWFKCVSKHLKKNVNNLSLLDIGCGVGGFLDFATKRNINCFGFDASEAHIEESIKRHTNVRHSTSVGDYSKSINRPLESIDLVTLWDVFEHIRDPIIFLNEIKGVMKKDGLLFISVPNGSINPLKVLFARIFRRPIGLIPWEHVFYYTPKGLKKVIENCGFEVLELGGVKPYSRPFTLHELVRRFLHYLLKNTKYSFQIYILAKSS